MSATQGANMTKIYIVSAADHDDSVVVGAFSTRDAADKIAAQIDDDPSGWRGKVKAVEVDAIDRLDTRPLWYAYSQMSHPSVGRVSTAVFSACWVESNLEVEESSGPHADERILTMGRFRADTREEAFKIASEAFKAYAEKTGWPKSKESSRG